MERPDESPPGEEPTSHSSESLEDALKRQLEFYFSPQNLATDAYLTSKMNAQKYVSVDVIANFPKVKQLTQDRALLVNAMKTCKNLALDETGNLVRPTLKAERKTLLLRDIPQDTPIEEIKKIFDDDKKCSKVVSLHADVGDTWYVNFETEEGCLNTAMYITSSGKKFKDKAIHCRVKSENLLRGYFVQKDGPGQGGGRGEWRGAQPQGPYPYGGGYVPYGMPYYWPGPGYPPPPMERRGRRGDGRRGRKGRGGGGDSGQEGASPMDGVGGGEGGGRGGGEGGRGGGGGGRGKRGGFRNKGRRGSSGGSDSGKPPRGPPPQLGPEHFPALPNKTKQPTGYSRPYKQYTRETMAQIVDTMGEGVVRPASLPPPEECVVLRTTPATHTMLLEPMPVMYPASPSPLLAAQPHHSSEVMPFLDLGMGAVDIAIDVPDIAPSQPHSQPQPAPDTVTALHTLQSPPQAAKSLPQAAKDSEQQKPQSKGGKPPKGGKHPSKDQAPAPGHAVHAAHAPAAAPASAPAAAAASGGEKKTLARIVRAAEDASKFPPSKDSGSSKAAAPSQHAQPVEKSDQESGQGGKGKSNKPPSKGRPKRGGSTSGNEGKAKKKDSAAPSGKASYADMAKRLAAAKGE